VIGPTDDQLYFFHPDHLGSTSYVTDEDGDIHEHVEYFPFGETWYQEGGNNKVTPYLFTSKELDSETGYYYFGARYYDPRVSTWISPDPILEKYLPTEQGSKPLANGVFETGNLGLFSYARNNPVILKDPDGNWVPIAIGLGALGGGLNVYKQMVGEGKKFSEVNWTEAGGAALTTAVGGVYFKAAKTVMSTTQATTAAVIATTGPALTVDAIVNQSKPDNEKKSMSESMADVIEETGIGVLTGKLLDGDVASTTAKELIDMSVDTIQEEYSKPDNSSPTTNSETQQ